MKKLILHIGTQKTGTSSLQEFLLQNKDAIAAQGIAVPYFSRYPRVGLIPPIGQQINGHFLTVAAQSVTQPESNAEKHIKLMKKDFEAFKQVVENNDVILLSDEAMWFSGSRGIEYWAELKRLLSLCKIEEVVFLVYLRRQDEFLESLWRQQVKTGITAETFDGYLSYLERNQPVHNYRSNLSNIESVFGKNHILIRVYDRSRFIDGNLYHDFCDLAGIAWNDTFIIPHQELNPSMNATATEIKRWANGNELHRASFGFLIKPAISYSQQNETVNVRTHVSASVYENLRERYLKDNEFIASNYLNGNGGKLIEWPEYDKEPWHAEPEEFLEAIVQMFSETIAGMKKELSASNKSISAQQKEIAELKQRLTKFEKATQTPIRRYLGRPIRHLFRHLRK